MELPLLRDCEMHFDELVIPNGGSVRSGKAQKANRTGRLFNVLLSGRSLVVMNGDAWWRWQHGILRTSKRRGLGWERMSLMYRVRG